MSRNTSIIAGLQLAAAVAQSVGAQWNVTGFDKPQTRVYTTVGLDPAIVGSVGLAKTGTLFRHGFQIGAEAGVVVAGQDLDDYRTRLGVQTSLGRWRSVNLTGSATAVVRGTENAVYRGISFGADVAATLGVYRPRWFAAGEAGWDKSVITKLTHTDWYRENFYSDARDGWYLDAGGTYRTGVVAGVSIRRIELATRVGVQRTERYNSLNPPFYGSIGVGLSR